MKSKIISSIFGALLALATVSSLAAADGGPRVIKLKAGMENQMKFDVSSIAVAPGESVKVVLTNVCALPKTVMGHNWVLLAKGTDSVAFANAAAPEAATEYIPPKLKDKVLAAVKLLGPNESGEVTFTAPREPGEYPFLCTFPAHCAIGMKGVLVVR
jgi:azurin